MSTRNTILFGAALAASTAAIAYDHVTNPVPPRPSAESAVATGAAPCAAGAAPCAAGAPVKAAPPPPPAAPPAATQKLAPPPPPATPPVAEPEKSAPPPAPKAKPEGEEAADLVVEGG